MVQRSFVRRGMDRLASFVALPAVVANVARTSASAAMLDSLIAFKASCPPDRRPLAWWSERSFSQNGEDGIVAEIFRRLGTKLETFVEIGAGDGTENNTIRWLLDGARGLWIECDEKNCASIRAHHGSAIADGRLQIAQDIATAENIEKIISENYGGSAVDLLSIDIDGNDYWVWSALTSLTPKVVIMEFNGRYGSSLSWTMAYDADHVWPGGVCHYGASLKALEKLGRKKGYALVGVDFMGVNAFFVQNLLATEAAFPGPRTSEELFQPFRRVLASLPSGKAATFGKYENP